MKTSIWPPKPPDAEFADIDNDNIRGLGGKDYPIYAFIPKTSFTCNGQMPGFYADVEAECQVFHLCNNNHKISFLCGNGTLFNQRLFTCNWWYNTTCSDSPKYYSMNAELYKSKATKSAENLKDIAIRKNEDKNARTDAKPMPQKDNKAVPHKVFRLPQTAQPVITKSPAQVITEKEREEQQNHSLNQKNDPGIRNAHSDPETDESEFESVDDPDIEDEYTSDE